MAKEKSKMKKKSPVPKVVWSILLILFALLMITPFLWMLSSSFKLERDVMKFPIEWIPANPILNNYKNVLHIGVKSKDYHFLLAYANSIKVSVFATLTSVLSAMLAGYAFAKLKFKGSNVLFIIYLMQMMVPSQLTLIPRFVAFSELGLVNTHFSIIAPKIISVSATFMMRQAFMAVPEELRESAKIDGAGEWKTCWRIMVPQIRPTIGAMTTVAFLDNWNSYLDPLVFLSDWRLMTLPIALNQFVSEEGSKYGLISAACCLTVIPVFIVFLVGQKFFIKGLTVGAVKG